MSISKRIRELVYNKYDGHCAYCGKKLTLREMQVDHLVPILRGWSDNTIKNLDDYVVGYNKLAEKLGFEKVSTAHVERGKDDINNYMPACRQCNFRKGTFSLEDFRQQIAKQAETLMGTFQGRMSSAYGLINYTPHNIVFYFERKDHE